MRLRKDSNPPAAQPWYREWFGELYSKLYLHRDQEQADTQVAFLLDRTSMGPDSRVLDLGCGNGRHLLAMSSRGLHPVGTDLSEHLLGQAAHLTSSSPLVRADMQHLPFRAFSFDLISSFFTSFGYFDTPEQDRMVLAELAKLLKPSGFLFLDLMNKAPLLRNLVAQDKRRTPKGWVQQNRRLEGDVVVKDIEIQTHGSTVQRFQERVRLYELEEMVALATPLRLDLVECYGSEAGETYHPENSSRMSLLLQRRKS